MLDHGQKLRHAVHEGLAADEVHVAVGAGLLRGRRWARSPAIVTQLLLLPIVYSLLGPSRQVLLGVLTGVWVLSTFLLLISERSRIWSMDLDPEAQPPSAERP